MNVLQHGLLGQSTDYPTSYCPDILYPISRQLGRESLALPAEQLSLGVDFWHCFEVSWLDNNHISQVAMLRLSIAANSPLIIESKSLKLYLNSLNFTIFDCQDSVLATIRRDLSACLQTQVEISLFELNQPDSLPIDKPDGVCIDKACQNKKIALSTQVDSGLLGMPSDGQMVKQSYYSHLLRSNCPVTNQPDWGTVQIDIESPLIDCANLLAYLLSYRQHNGFHEQCVEQIFCDLTCAFRPKTLMVRAWYTRRGGIDINPVRVSDLSLLPKPSRLIRQ